MRLLFFVYLRKYKKKKKKSYLATRKLSERMRRGARGTKKFGVLVAVHRLVTLLHCIIKPFVIQ